MKYLIATIILIGFSGAGCLNTETHTRFTPYEAPYNDPFYYNDTYTNQPFEITLPEGWYLKEEPVANIVILVGPDANHITLQVFTEEDPTSMLKDHLNEITESSINTGQYLGTKLQGYGEGLYEKTGVTHVIISTTAGWFVFSSDEDDQNLTDVMNSLKFKI